MIYTVLITVGRIGAIWAKKQAIRKGFQTLTSVAVMLTIIHVNKQKNNKLNGPRNSVHKIPRGGNKQNQ